MRAFMPFLKKYIPGEPTILAEYMAGAGGRKLANHMYLVAKPDGLTVGFPPGAFVTSAIMKETGVSYDIDKLVFLGSPESSTQYVFLTKKELGLNSLDKLKSKSNLRIGGQSVGHTVYIVGRLFAFVLGLKTPSFVTGYSGTRARRRSAARGNRRPSKHRRYYSAANAGVPTERTGGFSFDTGDPQR